MPLTLERFAAVRPYLYHLTATENVERILRMGRLESAAKLMRDAGEPGHTRTRRKKHLELRIGAERLRIRDQAPLHRGNVELPEDWELGDLVAMLNGRVFFWPGWSDGPIDYGRRHFERYQAEQPTLIRVRTRELLEANPGTTPRFCRYNSGSPRCNRGRKSPRGPTTFVPAEKADFGPTAVVEVTFLDGVALPSDIEVARITAGPWNRERVGAP